MALKNITSYQQLIDETINHKQSFLLLYKSGSEQSDCAKKHIEEFESSGKTSLLGCDVSMIKDIHTRFDITTAPSLLEFQGGKLINITKGCQTQEFYEALISGKGFSKALDAEGKPAKRVTVYTTPTCTWCTTIKTHLRENNINFTEVDVASNPSRAEEMVRKSGQQGVPQTDINGQVIVGFDKAKINQLLEIQ